MPNVDVIAKDVDQKVTIDAKKVLWKVWCLQSILWIIF
jgi:hypothetical protein